MKKSLLALAVLGAYAGVASAQSSVQLFGTLDVGVKYIKNSGRDKAISEETDGINSSEIRFQGVEDLGGGLKAGFNIRSGINPDTGTSNATKFWNRRATVSLYSNAGELRLGRDYVPTFWTQALFDPFGYNGIGNIGNVARYGQVRQDNSIGYFLPSNLGGWYGQLMVAAAENGTSGDLGGRYIGGQFGFRAGPFDIAGAYSEARLNNGVAASPSIGRVAILAGDKLKEANVGGSWDFGVVKIMGVYDQEKFGTGKEQRWEFGAVFPFGQSEVRVGYMEDKVDPSAAGLIDTKLTNLAATYQYNLSKRTALYGTAAYLRNKNGTSASLPGAFQAPTANGTSKGFEAGIRHFF
jgi:predicted porin